MLVSIRTRYTIQLIPCQIRIMATVDEVVVHGVIEINRSSWGGRIGGGGGHVGEEFVVMRRKGELMELGSWEEANAGRDGRKVGLDLRGEREGRGFRHGGWSGTDGEERWVCHLQKFCERT